MHCIMITKENLVGEFFNKLYNTNFFVDQYLSEILEIKKTKLFSTFLDNRDQSLFAKVEFKPNDYVTPFGHKINQMMNDGMFDLSPFIDTNNVRLEDAFIDAENSYYDVEKADRVVNIVR